MWSIELQCRRLNSSEPEDDVFLFRRWADFDYLVVGLTRLRRAATLAAKVPKIRAQMVEARDRFDAELPDLKRMRDVAEHVDDYAVDKGRDPTVARQALEVSYMSEDGPTLTWLGVELNAGDAVRCSQDLFKAMQDLASVLVSTEDPRA
jgi:hypothetical protein